MFIAIDGPDGIGKTTLANKIINKLKNELCIESILTTEPTKSKLGMEIRKQLSLGNTDNKLLLNMFLQDRKEHIENEIIPSIQNKKIILTDRYKYSTVVYQYFQGFTIKELIEMNDFLSPDVIFIVNGSFELIKERMDRRAIDKEIFEQDNYIKESIKLYSQMNLFFPNENILFIDGRKTLEELENEVVKIIVEMYKEKSI